jgi:hypothetical protein
MFSLEVVGSDAFIEMPVSARELYFQLGMYADDDGFLANVKKIMRMVNASEDDLKVLLSKRYLLNFPSGVVVIKHWGMNNYIAKDRHKPTAYIEEKSLLFLKDNGAYTDCIQNVKSLSTQYSIGKDSIDKIKASNKISNNGVITLNDGTKAKNYFGTWVDAKDNQVKINVAYYPELKNYELS